MVGRPASRLGRLADEDQQIQNAKDIVEFQHYFADLIDRMREHPEDNIISDLANNTIDEGRLLTKPEALGMIQQILVAGNETSTNAIAGVVLLIQNPDEQAKLRANPELINSAVEEILRLETPTSGMWRRATQDTEIDSVAIPEGSFLMVRFAAGNRDESIFPAAATCESIEITLIATSLSDRAPIFVLVRSCPNRAASRAHCSA